jgi:hypothetical protein
LEDNIKRRGENAKKLLDVFKNRNCDEIIIFSPPPGAVYWRFNIFINKNRDNLLKQLLEKKYKVSSWYPSVDIYFESRIQSHVVTPLSDWVGDTILNLWVNQEVDDQYIHEITDDILSFVEGRRDEGR